MSKLLTESVAFRPFIYPWAVEMWDDHDRMHWTKHEVPMGDDVTDWKSGKMTEAQQAFITQILRMFTQSDVAVGGFYHDMLIPKFKNNEIRNLLASFAAREITHQHSYALVNDTLGLPEGEYTAFMQYKEMADKAAFMVDADPDTHSGLALAIAKGVFNEGVSLFASFAMLLSFQRRGLMKAMGKVVEWSIKDETQHVFGLGMLFNTFCAEFPHIVTDKFKHSIYDMARTCVELEDAFIDSAYELSGDMPDLPKSDVKQYIRFIADRRLMMLGMKENFMVAKNPCDWLDWVVTAPRHTNFFENKSTEYEKGGLLGEWTYPNRSTVFRIYWKPDCPWCVKAKELLILHGFKFDAVELRDEGERNRFYNGRLMWDEQRTMPKVYQIATGEPEKLIGGYTQLKAFLGEI